MSLPFGGNGLNETPKVAVFIDFENIKRSVDEFFANERVDLKRILEDITQITHGRIVLKRAYADWGAFRDYRSDLMENSTEPVQAFTLTQKGKNGTDIRIAIDAMECVFRQPDISHVALVSGDSDFTPLAGKLREFGRIVIGIGVRANTSTYLAKSCDRFIYYDDLREGENIGRNAAPMDPARLLLFALAALGNRPVPGSTLKQQMRKTDPHFDEARYGYASFLDFLRAHSTVVDVYKPAVGDITVGTKNSFAGAAPAAQQASAPQTGAPGETSTVAEATPAPLPTFQNPAYTPYVPSGGIPYQAPPPVNNFPQGPYNAPLAPLTQAERYRLWLRDNNFRHVPADERHEIVQVLYSIFYDAEEAGEGVSLKEAKDRLHAWFEENHPAVSWESINSAVYHLFYTWCFSFDRSPEDENKQLWDRRTTLQNDIRSAEELIAKSERGIVRRLWEKERESLDLPALNEWLFDGDPVGVDTLQNIVNLISSPSYTTVGRNGESR
jgi:uncharacterized protein (TIGR00288 family)